MPQRTLRLIGGVLLTSILLLAVSGCDEDDDNREGRYPPPDSGNVAVVTLLHRQLETGREAISFGWVEVLNNGARTIDADVTLAGQALHYDSRDQAFTEQLTPPLIPGTSYGVRVRSATWGEDTTFVYLPGDFPLQPSQLGLEWEPGMEYDIGWGSSNRAQRFIVRIAVVDSVQALVQDTLAADVTGYSWMIPEDAGGKTVRIRVAAERSVNDPPVWSGTAQTYSDFELSVNP